MKYMLDVDKAIIETDSFAMMAGTSNVDEGERGDI
jgi:hypothetical protein